ncbi:MAG: 16S rRNA (guanine(527)-N(7))-methyltransferase RsmG [Planctomycetota bacterium]
MIDPLPVPASFADRCSEIGVELEPGETDQIGRYLALLLDANARVNLTAIKTPDAAWDRHALDALTLLGVLADCEPKGDRLSIADVGTGGGVPGIIIAVARPDADVTLIDATAKKTAFLETAVDALGLTNCRVVTGRAEDLGAFQTPGGRGEMRDAFDVVVARAVARVAVASELCVPLARELGRVILVKGAKAPEELEDAKRALYELHAVPLGIVETPTGRLVVIEKTRRTPKRFPRRSGEPARCPIG